MHAAVRSLLSLVLAGDAFWSMGRYWLAIHAFVVFGLYLGCFPSTLFPPLGNIISVPTFLEHACHLCTKHPVHPSRLFLRTCWANREPWFARLTLKPESATMSCGDKIPLAGAWVVFLHELEGMDCHY